MPLESKEAQLLLTATQTPFGPNIHLAEHYKHLWLSQSHLLHPISVGPVWLDNVQTPFNKLYPL
jgi:hypothetical protein